MPPRRSRGAGKTSAARAAAIQQAFRNSNRCRQDEDGESSDSDMEMPPQMNQNNDKNYSQYHNNSSSICTVIPTSMSTAMASSGKRPCPGSDNKGKYKAGSSPNDETAACLHCRTVSTEVQVRCDECNAYVCNSCHWCHEFQANHEIRVCDRCDAFYCRSCDEMDQCDDCGEVVCASCSTLLSCKFCGGGLCEECATACGRCGIVLCSRDAKFAVDCDTCRMSYCLVCLASGSKDPCVRCGHRPSKRMEQLVHLRLKSIYKAFKQSTRQASSSSSNLLERESDDPDDDHVADDPEALLQAAASAAKSSAQSSSSSKRKKDSSSPELDRKSAAVLRQEKVDRFMAEKKKAEEAAAELLAELDKEEQAVKKKKNKKKKKKEKQHAKRDEEKKKESGNSGNIGEADGSKEGKEDAEHRRQESIGSDSDVSRASLTEPVEEVVGGGGENRFSSEAIITNEKAKHAIKDDYERPKRQDSLEEEVSNLEDDHDIEGLEKLLASVKGVPGKAALRKNAKKALKRLRLQEAEIEEERALEDDRAAVATEATAFGHSSTGVAAPPHRLHESSGSAPNTNNTGPPHTQNMIKIISMTHNKSSIHCPGNGRTRVGVASGATKSECIIHMVPFIVGWVIGKGGQRIRDIMDESGSRIWIDQDTMKPSEPRIVYVSGNRKSVETAVKMIQSLIARAPPPGGTANSRHPTPMAEHITGATNATGGDGKAATDKMAPEPSQLTGSPGVQPEQRHNDTAGDSVTRPPGKADAFVKAKHVMTCDPRFVPLLIGRRGWTIKHIQDSSGSRVDIDQSVTPRKITISGSEKNVKVAIGMVRDVLSYPHAQLGYKADHSGSPINHHDEDPPLAMPADAGSPQDPNVPAPVEKQEAHPVAQAVTHSPPQDSSPVNIGREPPHSPPPSSLIMTGDAKSTISASSSLSSTPEPSMTSSTSVKGNHANLAPGPMLPPSYGHSGQLIPATQATPEPNAFQNSVPETGAGMFPGGGIVNQERLFGMPQQTPAYSPPSSGPAGPSIQSQQQHPAAHIGTTMDNLIGSQQPPGSFSLRPEPPAFQNSNPVGLRLPSVPRDHQNPLSSGQGSAFRPSQSTLPFNAAVEFLEHSIQPQELAGPAHLNRHANEYVGLTNPMPAEQNAGAVGIEGQVKGPGSLTIPVKNESLMVDSMFGPADNAVGNGNNLVTGFQGLDIGSETLREGGGLWGQSKVGDRSDGIASLRQNEDAVHQKETSPFFSAIQPTLEANEQHPPKSRFFWGASSDGQS